MKGTLASVQVGQPQHYGTEGAPAKLDQPWHTSFFRAPSAEPRWLFTTHLEGNEQADKRNHGTLDQAVLLYAAANYELWQAELGRDDMGAGGFGENFTVTELSEATVCIGDIYAIGDAVIEVTGPRYPCWKISQRWGIADLTDRVAATGRTGWYAQVRHEGQIAPGAAITLVERPYADITIGAINACAHGHNRDRDQVRTLMASPALDDFWRNVIARQLRSATATSPET
ncbi:MAG: MOSC domain-containing protein [Ktedonobacterales bacterium]|nr:MOSC domain-containing protein [Ktedonobacterales bacterium]